MPSLQRTVNSFYLPLMKLFAVNNCLPLIELFTLNNNILPLIKTFTVNRIIYR